MKVLLSFITKCITSTGAKIMFFEFDNLYFSKKGYPYAINVHTDDNRSIRYLCPECGAVNYNTINEFIVDLENGTKYPDYLFCSDYDMPIIVSEKVIDDWNKDGITGYEYYTVTIDKIKSKKLKDQFKPNYYHIVINGFCNWDKQKSDIKIINRCQQCGHITDNADWINKGSTFFLKSDTWDGCDIFKTRDFNFAFCSKKVVQCASNHNHSGISFLYAEDIFKLVNERRYVKFAL